MEELMTGRFQKIVGIDAEFVSLSEEETVLRSDGSSAVRLLAVFLAALFN
jgi:L-fucose mutarotase/ribose pyranase (RbsD/FucU family)